MGKFKNNHSRLMTQPLGLEFLIYEKMCYFAHVFQFHDSYIDRKIIEINP